MKITPPRTTLTGAETADSSSAADGSKTSASRPSPRLRPPYNLCASQSVRPPSAMPMRRGTESAPQKPQGSRVRQTPAAYAVLVDRARAWANQVLGRGEIGQGQVAALRGELEGLTLLLHDLERQLQRRDMSGLHAGEAMRLFYLALALRQEEPIPGDGMALNYLCDVAFQIRTALMRSVESSDTL